MIKCSSLCSPQCLDSASLADNQQLQSTETPHHHHTHCQHLAHSRLPYIQFCKKIHSPIYSKLVQCDLQQLLPHTIEGVHKATRLLKSTVSTVDSAYSNGGEKSPNDKFGEFSAQFSQQKYYKPLILYVVSIARTAKQVSWCAAYNTHISSGPYNSAAYDIPSADL